MKVLLENIVAFPFPHKNTQREKVFYQQISNFSSNVVRLESEVRETSHNNIVAQKKKL